LRLRSLESRLKITLHLETSKSEILAAVPKEEKAAIERTVQDEVDSIIAVLHKVRWLLHPVTFRDHDRSSPAQETVEADVKGTVYRVSIGPGYEVKRILDADETCEAFISGVPMFVNDISSINNSSASSLSASSSQRQVTGRAASSASSSKTAVADRSQKRKDDKTKRRYTEVREISAAV